MKEFTIETPKHPLSITVFVPKERPKFAVILNSASGTKQSYYRTFASFLLQNGILALTYDYSGIGKSAPTSLKNFDTSASIWGENDLTAVIDYVSSNYAYDKLVLMGLSMGGQIHGLSPLVGRADALVNVASQSGYWKLWPYPQRFALLLNWYLIPTLTWIFGYLPSKKMGIMEDLPREVAMEWTRWGRSANYLFDHVPNAKEKYAAIRVPLWSYSFTDDTTATGPAVEWMNGRYSNCELHYRKVSPAELGLKSIGHFGFFRESCKPLWEELLKELNEKV